MYCQLSAQVQLMEVINSHRFGFAIEFILATRVRHAKLTGLRWADVDFTKGCFTVRQTIMRKKILMKINRQKPVLL